MQKILEFIIPLVPFISTFVVFLFIYRLLSIALSLLNELIHETIDYERRKQK